MKLSQSKFSLPKFISWKIAVFLLLLVLVGGTYFYYQNSSFLNNKIAGLLSTEADLRNKLADVQKQLDTLKNEDQVKKNKDLEASIKIIEDTYKRAVTIYEKMLDFQGSTKKDAYTEEFAKSLNYLSERNYASASATLDDLDKQITDEQAKAIAAQAAAAAATLPVNAPANNTPPSSGYSRQKVSGDFGDIIVDIISADLNSTRVIVDTGSDSDCHDNCPVLSLADYAARSGAYAGVNGSYFCPADYPSCAGKVNSFDTLVMNKNKHYLNSDNNVYSTIPAIIFSGTSARLVGASKDWGRDTNVDSVIANYPILVSGGNAVGSGGSDAKQTNKGNRGFVGASGSTAYIGVVHNVSVSDMAQVLQKMGIKDALNLDSGGSTALWSGGYKDGPGRALPNAVLFVRK